MRQADKGGPKSREQGSPSGLPQFSSARNLLASAAPPNLPTVGAWGGQGWGWSPQCPAAPPCPHLPVQEGGGRRERAQLTPLLAEGLEPDRVSRTGLRG